MSEKIRWKSFDVLKGICRIAVVLIHYPFTRFLESAGHVVAAASRFAVPVFFGISGFFLASSDGHITDAGLAKKIRHVLRLTLGSGAFYLVFCLWWNMESNDAFSPYVYMAEKVQAGNIVKFFLTNDPFVYSHLWYLFALAYCYGFALFLMQDGARARRLAWLAPVLLLGMTLLQEFSAYLPFKNSLAISGSQTRLQIYNLFVFRALPFFLFGYLARVYREKLSARKVSKGLLIALAVIGCGIGAAERFLIGKSCQFYLGTYLTVGSLFLLALQNPGMDNRALGYIGRELSLYVYILHIAVGKCYDLVAGKFNLWGKTWFIVTRPLIVVIGSLLAAWVVHKIFAAWGARKRKRTSIQ